MNLTNEINRILYLLNKREFKKVINLSEKLINKKVKNTEVYNLCGLACQNLGLYEKSIINFQKSIQLEKKNYSALNNLALSFKYLDKIQLSEKTYENCLKIKPDYLMAILNYADLKEQKNEVQKSIDLYLSALRLNPEFNKNYIFSKLSRLYMSKGNSKAAKSYALEILRKDPNDTSAYALLSDTDDFLNEKKIISEMENLYQNKNLADDDVINLSFPLGKFYDYLKKFDKAHAYFSKGNELKRKKIHYNYRDFEALIRSIKRIFQNTDIYDAKKDIFEKKIIFICGMPRSGTSLVEQIISSHKEVLPTGENNLLSPFIKKNYLYKFSLDGKKVIKDIFSKENKIQQYYLNLLNEYKFSSSVLTDKSIQNFLWIGFIKIFFPNSKIIITDRNPRDVCLSIYKINFKNGFMNFAYNENEIANFYNNYVDLINFWKSLFKDDIFINNYENLTNNPEVQIKNLIDFCGLTWDPNCLRPHKNKSAIKTASINQARKPIYQTSKNISNNYSTHLEKMYSLLKY